MHPFRISASPWSLWSFLSLGFLLGLGLPWGKGSALAQEGPRPVVVATVLPLREAPSFEVSGLLAPMDKAVLSIEGAGKVESIRRRLGDRVQKNDVLARLENTDMKLNEAVLQARVTEARVELALARRQLKRSTQLHQQKLASAEQLDHQQSQVKKTQARHTRALAEHRRLKAQLSTLTLRAPISGQVIFADLKLGEWIRSTRPIYEIHDPARIELQVGLPGRFMAQVPLFAKVRLEVREIGKELEGSILAVVRYVDSHSGNFMLRIGAENPERIPLNGLLAHVKVPVGDGGVVLTVPRDAIIRRKGETQVVVVRQGRAAIVAVRIKGGIRPSRVIVEGGLKAKEQVVVRGNERLFPGTAVRIAGNL